jgi:hypothetical protein
VRQSLHGLGGAPTRSARGAGRCRAGSNGHGHLTSRRGRGPSPPGQMGRTTSGRSSSQQGLTATGIDPRSEETTEAAGGWRTGAGARTSDEGGVTPADVVPETMTREVTPCSCQGALGTWPLQESPDTGGPENHGAPWEANQRAQGWMGVSTAASRALGRRPSGGQGQHRTGERPPSGTAGGPAETWTRVARGTHLADRKSACWKLST